MHEIHIVRSIKKRSVTLQVMPDASIRVTAPYFFPKSKINELIEEKAEWIQRHQQRVQFNIARKTSPTKDYLYLGKSYQLAIHPNQKRVVELSDKLYVASTNKRTIENYLLSWYKQQARKIIVERVHHYSKISGLTFGSISFGSAQTRWGSCSSEKNLRFNWKLIMAPLPVIDYVVTHELAHLTELNHSRSFWEEVRKMFPLYREYRTWLKRHGHTLSL